MSYGSYNPMLDIRPKDVPLDASQVLAAALEQMDDIIAATTHECSLESSGYDFSILKSNEVSSNITFSPKPEANSQPTSVTSINQILNNLKESIESSSDPNQKSVINELNMPSATAVYLWLQKVVQESTGDSPQIPISDDSGLQKVHELESDKKNLILQTSVLADQVDAQAHKIQELERHLDRKKAELLRLEQSIHQEVLARSTIENSKLELMTELSNLRLRLTAAERDRKESDDKCRKLEHEFVNLRACLIEYQTELTILKSKLSRNGTQVNPGFEVDKLKGTLESSNISTDKDQKVEDLKSSLQRYKKLQDVVISNYVNKSVSDTSAGEYSLSDVDSILSTLNDVSHSSSVENKLTSQSVKLAADNQFPVLKNQNGSSSGPLSVSFPKSSSVENLCPSSNVSLPSSQYGTMPRNTGSQVLQHLQNSLKQHEDEVDYSSKSLTLDRKESPKKDSVKEFSKTSKTLPGAGAKSSGVSFGKSLLKFVSGKRSTSELNLAAQECITIPSSEKENAEYISPVTQPFLIKTDKDKHKGFLRFFTKWKKTGSQNIDSIEGDFKRGGVRATAGPRLGWSRDVIQETDLPFVNWNTDMIVEWLHKLGLSMYANECKRWMCNGDVLAKASLTDLEKDLGIKNPLHRKKLSLAIKSMMNGLSNLPASINTLDYNWVVRWLDDVGLPQYKDSFSEARVDGRVLHFLTVDDLLFLKVTSQLHHISIRRGIQLLREKGFDPHCLIRRSLPDESKTYTPELVNLWSNHRVMEWLRTVDLSEYAPNLRGSGVHGAFIVYEPKFNTNLFATLLNIPPTKTLLRRHLATHFKHIVGEDLSLLKKEEDIDTPLSPSIKVKAVRKSQFALKKKRNKAESENEDYVCPMDIPVVSVSSKASECEKLVVRRNSDPSPHDSRHVELQSILQDDNLNEAPTTIV